MSGWVRSHWWAAQRFGLTPVALTKRYLPSAAGNARPRVLCVTVPKSGTHLLERVLCLHPDLHRRLVPTLHEGNVWDHGGLATLLPQLRPGEMLFAHLPHKPEFEADVHSSGVRSLLLVRDPRDIAVSEVHYTLANPGVPGHAALRDEPDHHARLRLVITGRDGQLAPLATRLARFVGWLDSDARLVRFEDLVGPEGGGDLDRQLETLRGVFDHVGAPLDDHDLGRLRDRVFSDASPTFRRGRVGGGREDITGDLADLFDREVGPLLPTFGYAADPPSR